MRSERQTTGYDAKSMFCRLGRPCGSGPSQAQLSRPALTDRHGTRYDEPQRKGGRRRCRRAWGLGKKPARVESRPPSCLGRSRQSLWRDMCAVLSHRVAEEESSRVDYGINVGIDKADSYNTSHKAAHPLAYRTRDIR